MVLVRNVLFSALRAMSRGDYAAAAAWFEAGDPPHSAEWMRGQLEPFFKEHSAIRIDPLARSPQNTRIVKGDDGMWRVEQIVWDPEDANDWVIQCTLDIDRSREAGHPVMALERIGT